MAEPRIFLAMPLRWFYRRGRATALGRAFSLFWAGWAALGLPPWRQQALELRGRSSGRVLRIAVVVTELDGAEYLVSMLGDCAWVRNARAAGEAVLVGRKRRRVALEEVPVGARAPVIQAYLRLAPGARPHLGLGRDASLGACAAVAARYPVFRLRALA